jgi:hypothetical protein
MSPSKPCKHCNGTGKVPDKSGTPGLVGTMELLRRNPDGLTCTEVARGTGASRQLAHRRLQKLRGEGLAAWEYAKRGMLWKAAEPAEAMCPSTPSRTGEADAQRSDE